MQADAEQKLTALHAEAKEALISGKINGRPRFKFQTLKGLPVAQRRSPTFHEAFIMFAVVARAMPARAHGRMSMLRDAREKANELDKYTAFEKLLEKHSGGVSFSAHGFVTTRLGDVDAAEIYGGVHQVVQQLKSRGYAVFANSGTLLGLIRDKAPIAYDDDIDLAVIFDVAGPDEAAAAFFRLFDQLKSTGIDAYFAGRGRAIIKLPSIAGFEVDLFPAYGTDDSFSVYPYAAGTFQRSDIVPLGTCEVSGLPIPAAPLRVLEQNYGSGWRTPDPRFVFPWKAQNRKFAKLLTAIEKNTNKPKTVLTYGTFDLFHVGHVHLLRRLSELGDRLIVGCSTDEFNDIKGKKCIMPYEDREIILRACRYVDDVIPESSWDQKPTDIRRLNADIFAMGDDWAGKFDDLGTYCDVIYLPRTEGVSTTGLRWIVTDNAAD